MKHITAILVLIGLNTSVYGNDLLSVLASQLSAARLNSKVALIACPSGIASLRDLSEETTVQYLGSPDIDEAGTGAGGKPTRVHQYFFAPPGTSWLGFAVPAGGYTAVMPIGQPFTILQLHYDENQRVVGAFCYED